MSSLSGLYMYHNLDNLVACNIIILMWILFSIQATLPPSSSLNWYEFWIYISFIVNTKTTVLVPSFVASILPQCSGSSCLSVILIVNHSDKYFLLSYYIKHKHIILCIIQFENLPFFTGRCVLVWGLVIWSIIIVTVSLALVSCNLWHDTLLS